MKQFTFDAETHTYKLDGVKLPSVTQIIKEVFGEREWWSDYFAGRGTALHLAVHYLDQGVLDDDSIDDAIRGRLEGYKLFKNETDYMVLRSEVPLFSKKYRYAGTLDLVLREKIRPINILADIKSSFDPTVFIQLGGYSLLAREYDYDWFGIKEAFAIVLNDHGRFQLHWIKKNKLKYWENAFLNVLSVYNLKKKHKI